MPSNFTLLLIRVACYLFVSIVLWELLPKKMKSKTYSQLNFFVFFGIIILINVLGSVLYNLVIKLL